jgi:hypothetical protein
MPGLPACRADDIARGQDECTNSAISLPASGESNIGQTGDSPPIKLRCKTKG